MKIGGHGTAVNIKFLATVADGYGKIGKRGSEEERKSGKKVKTKK